MPDFLSKLSEPFTVKTDNLKEKYKGTEKEQIMNTIFDKLDALDNVDSIMIDSFLEAPPELQKQTANGEIISGCSDFLGNWEHNILENGEISLSKIQKLFGQNVTIIDVKQAFEDLLIEKEKEKERLEKEHENFVNNMVNSINDENLPEEIKEFLDPNSTVDIIEIEGKKYYSITNDEAGVTIDYNEKGQRIRTTASFLNDGIYGAGEEIHILDEVGNSKVKINKYNNGLIEKHDLTTNKQTLEFGKTILEYEDTRLLSQEEITKRLSENTYKVEDGWKKTYKNITVNQGLLNETKLEFEHDENGNIKDIKVASEEKEQAIYLGDGMNANFKTPPIGISDEEKHALIQLINANARLGNDFELKIIGNTIEVMPTIMDADGNYVTNIPNIVKNDVIELLKQGFRADKDYKITQNENGDFKLDFESLKAMNYEGDEKIITYAKNGKSKQTTITNANEIKTTSTNINGELSTNMLSRSDQILMKLLENDFNSANQLLGDLVSDVHDFNIYEVGIQYEKITGKNLMTETINQYQKGNIDRKMLERLAILKTDPDREAEYEQAELKQIQEIYNKIIENTKIQKNFDPYQSSVNHLLSKISEKEIISDTKYKQTINNTQYTVELKNNILEIVQDEKTKTINLEGIPPNMQKNIMNCSPKVLFSLAKNGSKLIIQDFNGRKKTTMGTYNLENKEITLFAEVVIGKTLNKTLAHEVGHRYYTEPGSNPELENCFTEELEAWQNSEEAIKTGNATYCTNDILEFVAEAYALLEEGNTMSAYTICKYFPKTLALVKELIDKIDNE